MQQINGMQLAWCLTKFLTEIECKELRGGEWGELMYWQGWDCNEECLIMCLSHLILNKQRWVVLVGKQGTFHLYDENFPSMFIPLWLTTVDGA